MMINIKKISFKVLVWFDRARSADHFPGEMFKDIGFTEVVLPRASLGKETGIIPLFITL